MKKYKLKDQLVFEFKNDYAQFDKSAKWNWVSFHFIELYFEKDFICGPAYEISFSFLGLGFYFRYNTIKALRCFDRLDRKINKKIRNG